MRAAAIVGGLLAAAATAALVQSIFGAGKEGAPGFFGPGVLLADANLILQILLVTGLAFGFYLARKGRIEAHRVNQTIWARRAPVSPGCTRSSARLLQSRDCGWCCR